MNNLNNIIKEYNLSENPDGSFDCNSNIIIEHGIVKDGKLLIKFNKVDGVFCCEYNNLTTLEGTPNEVSDSFYCDCNPNLIISSLPKSFETFICQYNNLNPNSKSTKYVYIHHEQPN